MMVVEEVCGAEMAPLLLLVLGAVMLLYPGSWNTR